MKCLYLIKSEGTNLFKIGVSENPKKRLKELQTASAYNLTIISSIETKYANKLEKTLHRVYALSKKIDEDNVAFGEWFSLNENQVLEFNEKCKSIINTFKILESFQNKF